MSRFTMCEHTFLQKPGATKKYFQPKTTQQDQQGFINIPYKLAHMLKVSMKQNTIAQAEIRRAVCVSKPDWLNKAIKGISQGH